MADSLPPLQDAFRVSRKEAFVYLPNNPFSLGFPGEVWNAMLSYLVIPVPGKDMYVLASASSDFKTYTVVSSNAWHTVDSALMAAALVHDIIRKAQVP